MEPDRVEVSWFSVQIQYMGLIMFSSGQKPCGVPVHQSFRCRPIIGERLALKSSSFVRGKSRSRRGLCNGGIRTLNLPLVESFGRVWLPVEAS